MITVAKKVVGAGETIPCGEGDILYIEEVAGTSAKPPKLRVWYSERAEDIETTVEDLGEAEGLEIR